MLQAKTRWKQKQGDEESVRQLSRAIGVTPLVASLLLGRGWRTEEEITAFLYNDRQTFHDPYLLEHMDRAVERIRRAVEGGEQILVYGDYDADGVSSTSVLLLALQELGADAEFYIPNRFTEGYGPNAEAFRWAQRAGFSLIITVDTGISAVNEAQLAKDLGVDLIITDHHEPPPQLPEAYAIIHPKLSPRYPFHELAGVGVAFKLAHALLERVPEHLLDLAVLGTVADLVALQDENRLLVKRGLEKLRATKRPGYQALFKVADLSQKDLNEESVGFAIGPRINAVGRLEDAAPAVHLLLSEDPEEAWELAQEIDSLNKQRQEIVQQIAEEAIREIEQHYPPETNRVLVVAKEGWNVGVIGIVASKLVERFYRPAIVLGIDRDKGIAKGSARSIEGFDLFANLSDCRDILPHFGGHTMAAGMTLQLEHVDELRSRLNELAKQLTEEELTPVTPVDAVCRVEELTLKAAEELQLLAPFGMGNPKPRIQVENAAVESIRQIGADSTHLKLVLKGEGARLDVVGFGFGYLADEIAPSSAVSLVGELGINEWNNHRKPQLMLQDAAVRQWQLFDWRSVKGLARQLASLPADKLKLVCFEEETAVKLGLADYRVQLVTAEQIGTGAVSLENSYTVLLDLPPSLQALKDVMQSGFPARIYTVFHRETEHLFSTIPTRDHFKWYYSFLRQRGTFSLTEQGEQLCRHKGWSKDTVNFMTQVFFELEFVTIKNGVIYMSPSIQKRDLTESKTYRGKFEQLQLEKELVYSSYPQLQAWLDGIRTGAYIHEEA
ncbi:single-stranded-DNA-specific exonuclease RecJ [Ectobacillus ponti]|uniref:Single-stranded-DNA-specific exonuclease RecJ n=1 Tax=Ectobacillus ponti TaxID=2961894 RepID=A0AA42BNB4_9BACI|nr:single-stranded-DNA-specific exonuclease RecJ [Ectobacillus ponti]MCP8967286.1 single-stranded-DNA-specific exonuclease RecJ [Ectobacillus ponti]